MSFCGVLASRAWPVQALILTGLLALLAGLAYAVHLRPLMTQAALMVDALAHANADSVEPTAELHSGLQQARWQLSAGSAEPAVFELLSRLAEAHEVAIEQLQVVQASTAEHYLELPVQLRLRGAFSALAEFFADLAAQPRLITVQGLSLKPADAQLLHMQLQVRSYQPRSQPQLAPGAQPQAAQRRPVAMLRNPFAPSALAVQADVLQRLALEQLEMVGSLASRGVRYALIQADGRVHRLQVGDRLGRDQGQVAEIGERHVEVIQQVFVAGQGWQARRRTLALR
ncbi:pilus assembly protein PilP [Pseudomonas sp. B21-032]|uniref:pilus assembly protein PilP n=1 Tax=Pseudomonas sp. B21-032 TaxID=2895483 RepID=UPI00215F4773|nr:pilus assembly protein PilP [Pseudomonas sp. B21-032]UVL61949.1 pilus assembly protein PilP [Pseudomonas sp. B21-032]